LAPESGHVSRAKNFKRRVAGRLRREVMSRLGLKEQPVASPWADESFALRRIVALAPDIVLDVGANEGQFVDKLRSVGYANRIISFEPQQKVFAALASRTSAAPNWECHRLALGDQAATIHMHVSAFSPSSSLLPIGRLHVEMMPQTVEVGTEPVQVVRLDEWEGAPGLADKRLFLKLDVQGYELPALRGMGALLERMEGALVELNFRALFDGQSPYFEVMAVLEGAGLHFAGLTGINMHPTVSDFLWADAVFFRQQL
jgi:FkbM family methyltransferase